MNTLVTGANGQLGCALRLAALKSHDNWLFTDVCDASQETIAMLRRLGGDAVDASPPGRRCRGCLHGAT